MDPDLLHQRCHQQLLKLESMTEEQTRLEKLVHQTQWKANDYETQLAKLLEENTIMRASNEQRQEK